MIRGDPQPWSGNDSADNPEDLTPRAFKDGKMNLVVTVAEIEGRCFAYKHEDTFTLRDGHPLVSDVPVCMHALSALVPFYNALRISSPWEWKLAGEDDESKAYVQCPNAISHRGGGSVVFEISKIERTLDKSVFFRRCRLQARQLSPCKRQSLVRREEGGFLDYL